MARASVRLSLTCNNRCVFCAQHGLADAHASDAGAGRLPSDDEWRLLRSAHPDGVTFVGGEPSLDPRLPDAIRAARAHGFPRIGLQSNARRLADPELVASLADAGLTDLQVTLLGSEPAVHDYHTGVPGSLAQSVTGLSAARARGLDVFVTTVVTRSNLRSLSALPRLLASRRVSAWVLIAPRAAGRALASLERVVPRLGLAMPFALHALEAARRLGVPSFMAGAPLCSLGPFASRAISLEAGAAQLAFSEAKCGACAARSGCPGVDPVYLRRFGDEELVPLSALPAESSAGSGSDAALAGSFVGLGELFVPELDSVTVPEAPAAWRARIDELGKSRAAAAELPRGAEKKSGEELKSIFPELFGVAPEKPPYKPGH